MRGDGAGKQADFSYQLNICVPRKSAFNLQSGPSNSGVTVNERTHFGVNWLARMFTRSHVNTQLR